MTTPWSMVRAAARMVSGAPEGVVNDEDVAAWCGELESTETDKGDKV